MSASIRARLTNLSRSSGQSLQAVLIRFANERFLYRLSRSPHSDRFIVKGATAFDIWFLQSHRPTRDLDLLGYGESDIAAVEGTIRDICKAIGEPDGLDFLPDSVRGSRIREDQEYEGVRVDLLCMLGRARIPVRIDVGFGDAVTPAAGEVEMQGMLGLPGPRIRVYPPETVVAEKFEAMVRFGAANGRMKDYWDIAYLIAEKPFDGRTLHMALRNTFQKRGTGYPNQMPDSLMPRFGEDPTRLGIWRAFISRHGIERDTDFEKVLDSLRVFFLPLIGPERYGKLSDIVWRPGTGWTEERIGE